MTHYITRKCDNTTCNKTYNAEARYLNRGQGLYCSRSCAQIDISSKTPVKESNVTCFYCDKEKYVKPSIVKKSKNNIFFCNRECMVKAQQEGLLKTGPDSTRDVPRKRQLRETDPYCYNCNEIRSRRADKLCEKCFKEISIINDWLNGNNDIATYSYNEAKPFVKKYLIKIRGNKCEKCGETGYNNKTGNSIIQLDHKDGNSSNNLIDNLQLLCPNCHALTENYCSRNKKSARKNRGTTNKTIRSNSSNQKQYNKITKESLKRENINLYHECLTSECVNNTAFNQKYCMDCRDSEAYSLWLNSDTSKITDKNGLNIIGRRILLKESGYACSECGFDTTHPVDGNPVLQIDHIDGNSMNNALSNLRVLCPNCHAKTETFGSLNTGQGRAALRKLNNS